MSLAAEEDKSYAAYFELDTAKVSHDDACLRWLKMRYSRDGGVRGNNTREGADVFLRRLENDLSACAAHRWSHFSRRSPVYEAISPRDDCSKSNSTSACIEQTGTEGPNVDFKVTLRDPDWLTGAAMREERTLQEPSRHIFTRAIEKRDKMRIRNKIDTADVYCCSLNVLRPFFGGYFTSPLSAGPTRFLLFPQWMHDVNVSAGQRQAIPYFLRGSVDRRCGRPADDDTGPPRKKRGLPHQLLKDIIFNASFSRGLSATRSEWKLLKNVDSMNLDCYVNNKSVERTFLTSGGGGRHLEKVEQATTAVADAAKPYAVHFSDSGSRASFSLHNPRHLFTLSSDYRVARPSPHASTGKHNILSLTFVDSYDSAVQRFTSSLLRHWFPRATYHLQWLAGPGVEYVTDLKSWTVFGKLKTEWWVELPIFHRLLFRIRNQSALVCPLDRNGTKTGNKTLNDSDQGSTHGDGNNSSVHSLFWATQGPRWDATLVRGFKDDYASMHYASRWYTLVSAEIASGKHRRKKASEGGRQLSWMVYANACIMDSFANYPRASVGLSFSGAPRTVSNAFNVLTPFSFECSFNWWVKFGAGRLSLVSGFSPGQRVEQSEVRLSPAETFRHLRCGLTWKA